MTIRSIRPSLLLEWAFRRNRSRIKSVSYGTADARTRGIVVIRLVTVAGRKRLKRVLAMAVAAGQRDNDNTRVV